MLLCAEQNNYIERRSCGFTIVELLVVFSIFSIITAITVTTYPNFSSKIEFENQVLDIALGIRESQVYGMGVRETGVGTEIFDKAYGVYFETLAPNSYKLFIDTVGNDDKYNAGDEVRKNVIIKNGFTINDLCVESVCGKANLSFVFKRPDPDAIIFPSGAFGEIKIRNPAGEIKSIIITGTGQISTP